jgi:hypothetical protein
VGNPVYGLLTGCGGKVVGIKENYARERGGSVDTIVNIAGAIYKRTEPPIFELRSGNCLLNREDKDGL